MCGIFGRVGRGPMAPLQRLAISSQARGRDAGGVAWRNGGGGFHYMRRPGAIGKLLPLLPAGTLNSELIIGHTRFATTGDPLHNHNNHPFAGKGWIIVHNGFVFNHSKYETTGECDSEAILAVLEKHSEHGARKAIAHVAKELMGNFACAAVNLRDPCHVYLWRDGNPIWLGQMPHCLIFASEPQFIRQAYPKATLSALPELKIARVGRDGITHVWELPESRYVASYDPNDIAWHGGYDWHKDIPKITPPAAIDPIAWYSDYTFDVFCPHCAGMVADEFEMEITPIGTRDHWLLQEVSSTCAYCGDPLF